MIGTRTDRPGRALVALALGVLGAACLLALLATGPERAGAAQAKLLGKTKNTPKPDCPKSPCQAVGSMTGFQSGASGSKRPYRVRKKGSIVAWSIDLSRPNQKQRKFFGNFYKTSEFGTAPTARLAILAQKGKGASYKLRKQTPVSDLTNALGTTPIYTLKSPLSVREDNIVALTVPTWVSAFASDVSGSNTWRASRAKGKCQSDDDIKAGRPQTKVGGTRKYGCSYRGARLLYWAYLDQS